MLVKNEYVIIRIKQEDRDNLFSKMIVRNDGTMARLFTAVEAEKNSEESYSQSVTIGEVVAVGKDVVGIQAGDTAIMDYTVDVSEEYIVQELSDGKLVCVRAVTTYKTTDCVVDANRRTPHPTVVHRTGEVDEFSMVIGAVRNGDVYAVKPYLFCEPHDGVGAWVKAGALYVVDTEREEVVERKVLHAYEGCGVKEGEVICVHTDGVFDRTLNGRRFDIVPMHEVMATVRPVAEKD